MHIKRIRTNLSGLIEETYLDSTNFTKLESECFYQCAMEKSSIKEPTKARIIKVTDTLESLCVIS